LQLDHDPQRLSGLMRAILVEQMVNVDKQQRQVVNFLCSTRRFWSMNQNIQEIQKVDEQRVIKLFQLLLSLKMLWIQTSDGLALERTDYLVVIRECIAKNEGNNLCRVRWKKNFRFILTQTSCKHRSCQLTVALAPDSSKRFHLCRV
jgi:hypothetical protein